MNKKLNYISNIIALFLVFLLSLFYVETKNIINIKNSSFIYKNVSIQLLNYTFDNAYENIKIKNSENVLIIFFLDIYNKSNNIFSINKNIKLKFGNNFFESCSNCKNVLSFENKTLTLSFEFPSQLFLKNINNKFLYFYLDNNIYMVQF